MTDTDHHTGFAHNLAAVFADMASEVSQRALATDPALRARLGALEGKVIEIQCTNPSSQWQVVVSNHGLRVRPSDGSPAHAIVKGSALALASWFGPGESPSSLDISGDDTLLLELTDILKGFRPDLESPLGQFVGTETASSLLGTAELGLQTMQRAFAGFASSMQSQATGNFVNNAHLNDLLSGVDQLRLRVDRLAANISQRERQARGEKR